MLQSLEIPIIDFNTCLDKAPLGFRDKVLGDKVSESLSFIFYIFLSCFLIDLRWLSGR